mgnify:CR=1 FL=1
MKRTLALLLLLSVLFSASSLLSACQTPGGEGSGGGDGTMDVEFLDNLDAYGDSLDFSEYEEFVISFPEHFYYEIYGEEGSNEKLDTLVYNRNRLLESRFGIRIATEGGIADTAGVGHYQYVQLALNSGDVTFDAAAMISGQGGKLIFGNGGNLLDFRSEIPYVKDSIKAGNEWWPTDINIASTVMGRQFVAVSDFCITAMEMTYAVIFNKNLAKTENVANNLDPSTYSINATLYDVVNKNDWTLENMKTIVKGFYKNNPTSGNTSGRDVEDRFGLVGVGITDGDAWAYSLGYNYIINDGVSAPSVWEWDGTQYDAITSLRELYQSVGTWNQSVGSSLGDYRARAAFFAQENRVLFQLNNLESLKLDVIHNMEQDFGVLPYPKYNQSQAKHLTGSLDHYSVLAVPYTTAWDSERLRLTGAMLEALSAENCNSVKDPYYDEIVTHHNVTDGDSVEMINMIMDGRVYDLGMYHYNDLVFDATSEYDGAFALFFRYLIRNPEKDIVQYWQSYSLPLQLQMDALVNKYVTILMQ